MMNAYGKLPFGRIGPHGAPNGFGQYWEPDMYPAYDFANDSPDLDSDLVNIFFARRIALWNAPFNPGPGGDAKPRVEADGGICTPIPPTDTEVYRIILLKHEIVFEGRSYSHIAALRFPKYGTYTSSDEFPIIIVCHGNSREPVKLKDVKDFWQDNLIPDTFFSEGCAVLMPLYFGYAFEAPTLASYQGVCVNLFPADLEMFVGQRWDTVPTDSKEFQERFKADGYSEDEVQLLAVIQALRTVYAFKTTLLNDYGLRVINDVGLLGQSMGAGLVYDLAPILANASGTTELPNLKVCVALYGGTDQYAAFNVRRSKRYLASAVGEVYRNALTSRDELRPLYMYSDISIPQKERAESEYVADYLNGDYGKLTKQEYMEELRYWFLEDSMAHTWLYQERTQGIYTWGPGPWPLQVHHGTLDETVFVDNSRHLEQRMREEGITTGEGEDFEYFETAFAGHGLGELSTESKEAIARILQDNLS